MLAADPQTIVGLWSVGALPRTAAHKRRKYDIKRLSDITEWSEGELLSIAGRRRAGGRDHQRPDGAASARIASRSRRSPRTRAGLDAPV